MRLLPTLCLAFALLTTACRSAGQICREQLLELPTHSLVRGMDSGALDGTPFGLVRCAASLGDQADAYLQAEFDRVLVHANQLAELGALSELPPVPQLEPLVDLGPELLLLLLSTEASWGGRAGFGADDNCGMVPDHERIQEYERLPPLDQIERKLRNLEFSSRFAQTHHAPSVLVELAFFPLRFFTPGGRVSWVEVGRLWHAAEAVIQARLRLMIADRLLAVLGTRPGQEPLDELRFRLALGPEAPLHLRQPTHEAEPDPPNRRSTRRRSLGVLATTDPNLLEAVRLCNETADYLETRPEIVAHLVRDASKENSRALGASHIAISVVQTIWSLGIAVGIAHVEPAEITWLLGYLSLEAMPAITSNATFCGPTP